MATALIIPPFENFRDAAGNPIESGYIYIGNANQNPQLAPSPVYWDSSLTTPAAQPLRTAGGYIVRNGTPANVYTGASSFSMLVADKSGNVIYSAPSLSGQDDFRAELANSSDPTKGAALVGYSGRTVAAKLGESVSIADKGASTGAVDNKASIESAISVAGTPGTVFVPEGSFNCSAEPINQFGVEYVGPGSVMVPAQVPADGYRQVNTYADKNQVGIGREYLNRCFQYFGLGQNAPAGTLKMYLYGDSTVAGGNGESAPFKTETLLGTIFSAKGLPNVFITNRAISGSQISAHTAQAVSDLSNNPGLYILKSFINEGTQTLATRLNDTRIQLENFLNSVRSAPGGSEGALSIIVMGPNATNNTRFQRDAFWYEQLRGMIVATCRKYNAAYFDTYQALQDVLNASTVLYMDQPYPDRPLDSVHPLNAMQAQIWGMLINWIFPDEVAVNYKTNIFVNHGAQTFTFTNALAPSNYPLGWQKYRALTANGVPADGFVISSKNPDGGMLQLLFPFAAGDSRVLMRTANTAGNSWNPWTGQVQGPSSFTFLNGWQDYNDGNVVTSASFVLTSEGYVELFGMIKNGTTTDGTVVATLPAGYRPLNAENAITYSSHAQKFAVWAIGTNGNITCASGLSAAGTSLAGIKFRRGN